jgi:hypothetical protein
MQRASLLLPVLIALTCSVHAQQSQATELEIHLADAAGRPIVGGKIRIAPQPVGAPDFTLTDRFGETLLSVPPGNYSLIAEARGFKRKTLTIAAEKGNLRHVTTRLEVGEVGFGPNVEVSPNISLIEQDFTSLVPEHSLNSYTFRNPVEPFRKRRR